MPKLSICIPTYEMHGHGRAFLEHSFNLLVSQTHKDFEVVISDHSRDDSIKDLCTAFEDRLSIQYHRNSKKRGNSSANLNNSINYAYGELIKILFQDDFLYSHTSLQEIVDNFDPEKDHWLVTACEHSDDGKHFYRPFYPTYNDEIHLGENTISSPSVLTIKNDNPLLFDEKLVWLMDCDYYRRCHDTFGEPKILNTICVVNRTGEHQMSSSERTSKKIRGKEYVYILKKYNEIELLRKYKEGQVSKGLVLTPKVILRKTINKIRRYTN